MGRNIESKCPKRMRESCQASKFPYCPSHLTHLLGGALTTLPRIKGSKRGPPPLTWRGIKASEISETTLHVVTHPFTSGPLFLAIVASAARFAFILRLTEVLRLPSLEWGRLGATLPY